MRILLHSNAPWVKSGYGRQTAFLAQHAQAMGHEVAVSAFYGLSGTELEWNGVPVFPAGCRPNTYGMEMIPHFYRKWDADVVIILADAWVGEPYAREFAALNLNVANWLPVDSAPLSARDSAYLAISGALPIAMSRHGERMLRDASYEPLYLPHAIDLNVFKLPDEANRAQLRAELGADDSTCVIGMNAANRDLWRKGFFEQFTAFKQFNEAYPNSLLYVHTTVKHPQGLDLVSLAKNTGIQNNVLFPDQDVVVTGAVTDEMLVRNFYDLLDVYSGCSLAEGFGIPIIEAQACGLPAVVTNGSAMTELCGPDSALVEADRMWVEGHQGTWMKPRIDDITPAYADAWLQVFENGRSTANREFTAEYAYGSVADNHLEPVLKDLEARYGR